MKDMIDPEKTYLKESQENPENKTEDVNTVIELLHEEIKQRKLVEQENQRLLHERNERIKELTALHSTALLFQDETITLPELLQKIVALLPPAWQYPEITEARILYGDIEFTTLDFHQTVWTQKTEFITSYGKNGCIEVVYTEERPVEVEGPFLAEERNLINSLAEMLKYFLEHKHSEEAMKKLSIAVEESYDWVLITDRYGHIEYLNRAVTEITGYTKEELMGKNPKLLKSGKHDEEFYKNMWTTMLSGHAFRAILTNRKKDGSLFEVFHTITPLKDSKGTITHFIATAKDLTQQRQFEEKLNYLSYYDVLTGLPNRNLFIDRLNQLILRAEHEKKLVAVLAVDIKRFAYINDTFGPPVGDAVLKETGKRLVNSIRDGETVARFGNDEFEVAIGNISNTKDIVVAVEKIINEVTQPLKLISEDILISISIGISIYPNDGMDTLTLIKNSDAALLKAKAHGMTDYQFYTGDLNIRALEFISLERHLFNALKNNEFVMHYQPYFYTGTGKLAGMESLIRWNSPGSGMVSPAKFIPILEETGMIMEVGLWIMKTVCNQVLEWQQRGYSVVPVAVNFSPAQFRQKELGNILEDVIVESCIDPKFLTLEITESLFMQDFESARRVLERLSKMGVSISIDDFGTGYSSLARLKRIPINNLKIDISFIKDITSNADDASIVSTIISMAHNLGHKTIAEGIETEEQLKILRILRCDMVQGYYFSKSLPPDEVEKFLIRSERRD